MGDEKPKPDDSKLIQVAAPEGGMLFDTGSTKTEWQEHSDSFNTRPRTFFSKQDFTIVKVGNMELRRPYYIKMAVPGEIKGKQARRAARRQRVAAMKAEQK